MLLYHPVKEPARKWMRRMIDTSDVGNDAGKAAALHGRLQAVGGAPNARLAASARAG